MKKIAFYGGSFDPLHCGHLTIARELTEIFELDEFVFIPAFHAPHKKDKKPVSAFHRFAMLALATGGAPRLKISDLELLAPHRPYTVETLARLKNELENTRIFFVMGADSWQEITTWREWEKVLTLVDIIVVTRPDYEIGFSHVTDEIRSRIIDLRNGQLRTTDSRQPRTNSGPGIFITDAVQIDVSATEIRQKIRENRPGWQADLPPEVARYIEKYELYR